MDVITIGAAVLAVTEFIKRVFPTTISGALVIVAAAVIGGVFALINGTNLLQGVIVGLGASGVHTLGKTFAGN